MNIRETTEQDLDDVLLVGKKSFGNQKGLEIADLVDQLLHDPSAMPRLSLLAEIEEAIIGHILFTKAHLDPSANSESIAILAPLAVIPEAQSQGVGGRLINEGLRLLEEAELDLVFVLGHPEYYPRYGFSPAGAQGFEAPFATPGEHNNAWMVQELHQGAIRALSGKVICADALNHKIHWRK